MTTMNNVEQIVKHPAVSRVYANGPRIEVLTDNIALQALCRLRRMRRDSKRAIQNAREDVAASGGTDSAASMPHRERELAQLRIANANASLLPADLAAMVAAAL
jgi:predicted PP-loop superfamily ATPase